MANMYRHLAPKKGRDTESQQETIIEKIEASKVRIERTTKLKEPSLSSLCLTRYNTKFFMILSTTVICRNFGKTSSQLAIITPGT